MLELGRTGILKIVDGQKRPQEIYTKEPHRSTTKTPVHKVDDADGDDTTLKNNKAWPKNYRKQVPVHPSISWPRCIVSGAELNNVQTDSLVMAITQRDHTTCSCGTTATGVSYRRSSRSWISTNMTELIKRDHTKAAQLIRETYVQARVQLGTRANGHKDWRALLVKYENNPAVVR